MSLNTDSYRSATAFRIGQLIDPAISDAVKIHLADVLAGLVAMLIDELERERAACDGYQALLEAAAEEAGAPCPAELLGEIRRLLAVVAAADNGEWHSSRDCRVEGRAAECTICVALGALTTTPTTTSEAPQ